jgi:hypothetical protein
MENYFVNYPIIYGYSYRLRMIAAAINELYRIVRNE